MNEAFANLAAEGRDSKKSPAEIIAHELARRKTAYWQALASAPAATTPPAGQTQVSNQTVVAGIDLQAYMPMLLVAGSVAAFLLLRSKS